MLSSAHARVAGAVVLATAVATAAVGGARAAQDRTEPGPAPAAGLTPEALLAELGQPSDEPTDPVGGRNLYEARCGACHLFGAIGTGLGPDLTTASSRFRAIDIAEAVLFPSRVVSDQYAMEIVTTFDGRIVAGIVQGETTEAVFIVTPAAPERPVSIPVSSIESRQVIETSLMPPGLFEGLTVPQMRNVIAFVLGPAPQE